MKRFLTHLPIGLALLLSGAANAQPAQLPDPLYAENFEHGVGTWIKIGEGAHLTVDRTPGNAREGTGALRFDYQLKNGEFDLLIAPFAPPALGTLQSISFWIKADHTTSLLFSLQEQNGGRYATPFSVIKDQWQRVEITPGELVLQTGRDNPPDANGHLDVDKIDSCALIDFNAIFFQQAGTNPAFLQLMGVEPGPRSLFLDDLTLSARPLVTPDKTGIDGLTHPQAGWFSIGNVAIKTVRDEDPQKNALQVDYAQTQGHIAAFAKMLQLGALTGKSQISFNVVSTHHATLVVQFEEVSGGKYKTIVDVPAGTTPLSKLLPLADFKAADDSKDDNGQLDLGQVKQIIFIDASGLLGAQTGANTLWLNQLMVK